MDPATEAIRDLERARDDAKRAERAARQQLSKFLLRNGRWFEGRTKWGPAHLAWLAKQQFDDKAQQDVMNDYREAVELATARVGRLTARLAERVATWEKAPLVTALQALRRGRPGHRRDAGGGGGGLPPVPLGDGADVVRGPGAVGALQRREPAAGADHADGQRARASHPRGGGVALPAEAADEQGDPGAERQGVGGGAGDRLEGAAAAAQADVPADGRRQAVDAGGDGGGAGAGGIRLGDRP